MESVSSTAAWHGCSWRSGLSNSVFELDEDSTRSEASKKQLSTRVRPSEQAHLQSLVTPWQRIRRLVTSIYQSIESNLSVEKPHCGFVWEEGATKKSRGWSSVSQHCHYGIIMGYAKNFWTKPTLERPGQLSGTLEVDWSQTAIRADNQSAEWLQYFHLFASISIPFPMFQVGRGQEYLYILYPKIGEVL